jgi:glycolate oxidase FAD binding subunit
MGTLGLITDVSLRVIPEPQLTVTRSFELGADQALNRMRLLARQNFPVSATCYADERLYVRLSGEESSIGEAQLELGGESEEGADEFWEMLREQTMQFFTSHENLWRLSVPPSAPLTENQDIVIEWGGAQRWYKGVKADWSRSAAREVGGHATLFRTSASNIDRFQQLDPSINKIHQNIKNAFDPAGILNSGRMYADI